MLAASPRRLWGAIAAGGIAVIVAIGYFLFVSGEQSDAESLRSQAADARQQAAVARAKTNALRADNAKLGTYRSQLAALKASLPASTSSAAFLRDLQQVSSATGVVITSVVVTPPSTGATATQVVAGINSLPINVTALGTPTALERFLNVLQTQESRALVVGQAVESVPSGKDAGSNTKPSLTLTMTAFYTSS